MRPLRGRGGSGGAGVKQRVALQLPGSCMQACCKRRQLWLQRRQRLLDAGGEQPQPDRQIRRLSEAKLMRQPVRSQTV